MRGVAAAFVAMGVAGGAAVGVGQYQGSAPDGTRAVSAPVALPTARPTVVEVHVQPCEPGWTLKKGACVRVVRKVVQAAPSGPGSSAARGVTGVRHTRAGQAADSPTSAPTSHPSTERHDDGSDDAVESDTGQDEPGDGSDGVEQDD